MRYYKKKQAAMLKRVANFLKSHKDELVKKVPALMKDVITKFVEMEEGVYRGKTTNLTWQPAASASEKMTIRKAFEQVVLKLSSAVVAAGIGNKQKGVKQKHFTLGGLKRLTANGLCNEYTNAIAKVKKMRTPEFYGLTRDYLADAGAYYKEFNAIKGAPAKKKKECSVRME